jgi:hypothetical protein
MQFVAIQIYTHLTLDGLPPKGIDLDANVTISSDPALREAITNARALPWVGKLEADVVMGAQSFAHSLRRSPEPRMEKAVLLVFVRVFSASAKLFLLALWLIKDNSGNCGPAYVSVQEEGRIGMASQRHDAFYSTSAGTIETTHFTRSEVDRAVEYYRQVDTVLPKTKPALEEESTSGVIHESRIGRTLYFVQAARNAGDIAVKIAFYCICFESLFSTDTSGVSHRVAERAATFLGKTGTARRSIYSDVHELYGIRSKVVHGSPIKPSKLSEIVALTRRGDEHLRGCIRRILDEAPMLDLFSKRSSDAIQDHFLNELFPDAAEP